MNPSHRLLALTTTLALLSACGGSQTTDSNTANSPASSAPEVAATGNNLATSSPLAAALQNARRSAEDQERDASSRPAEVLAFFGVEPGMRVADLFSGGGYYSEVLSHTVGPAGQVTAHNNAPYASFAGDAPKERYADNRLANLQYLVSEASNLNLPDSLDLILMVMSFHDTYWVDEKSGWDKIDNRNFNRQLFDSLKPGGILAIVDHSAEAGSGIDAVPGLHRIDEAFVVSELEAAGFKLAETSGLLRNAEDDRTKLVFDPAIRRKTDRFLLRFEKP